MYTKKKNEATTVTVETKGVIGCFEGAVIVIDFASILILISRQQK